MGQRLRWVCFWADFPDICAGSEPQPSDGGADCGRRAEAALGLQRVDDYLEEHPNATVLEAAEEAGFISRKAYYSAKTRLRDNPS